VILVTTATLIVSVLLTGLVRKLAVSHGVLDVPNQRSSHKAPTPRGGGVAIVSANTMALAILAVLGDIKFDLVLALGGGLAVAWVGFLDDRHRLSARVRLVVHIMAAAWAVFWLGGLPSLRFGEQIIALGWTGDLLGILGIAWALNLFNFMDGIDGIAASEAIFVVLAAALLTLLGTDTTGLVAICLAFAAACSGFLLWNWPPAKIFMGDVGSGYLGYQLAVLALAATRENPVSLWCWLILGGIFFVDTTVTLTRRLANGERIYQAHRNHAYQWLSRRWGSHRLVTVAVILVNVVWLLPCALLAAMQPNRAPLVAIAALTPLVIVALVAGAGKREGMSHR
jgi:Fuc2NAc and GlcNAc transferase